MEVTFSDYHRFDVPPFDTVRMACGVNAIIEVFTLPVDKITSGNVPDIFDRVMRINKISFPLSTDIGTVSIKIQSIIDEKCLNQEDRDRVMNLCAHKYRHAVATRTLV